MEKVRFLMLEKPSVEVTGLGCCDLGPNAGARYLVSLGKNDWMKADLGERYGIDKGSFKYTKFSIIFLNFCLSDIRNDYIFLG